MEIAKFIGECQRVLKVTRKPNKEEFLTVVKASGIGILVIGGLGFIIYMLGHAFNVTL